MAKRTETIDALSVRDSADFGSNKLTSVAQGTAGTDAVNLDQLNAAAFAGGWDSVVWDEETGNLDFFIGAVLDYTVNIDDRYLTTTEVQALIDSSSNNVYTIELADGTSVQDRIDNSTANPYGWTLTASGLDLIITHALDRSLANVNVFVKIGTILPEYQQLLNTAANNGIVNVNDNAIKVLSLATVRKPIQLQIILA